GDGAGRAGDARHFRGDGHPRGPAEVARPERQRERLAAALVEAGDAHLGPPMDPIDKGRIEKAVREILEAIGEDPEREGLRRTPERVANMYEEIFCGLRDSPDHHLAVTFEAGHDEMIMVKDIPITSICVPTKERVNGVHGVIEAQ